MPTEDFNNIESLLEFSKQQDELIAGHQKEMQQVLRNKEQLRTALALEHELRMAVETENIELKKQIALLQAENKELKERPNIVTSQYIEKQTIGKQYRVSFPATPRSARRKLNINDQTQLPLWTDNATSM